MPRKGAKSDSTPEDETLFRSALDAVKKEILKELKTVSSALSTLQTKMCDIEGTLLKVLETQKRQDAEIENLKEDVLRIKESQVNLLAEIEERERRKSNLVISGLQEKEDGSVEERKQWDLAKVQAMFSDLDDTKAGAHVISNTFRVGKINSSKPRLLKVVCASVDTKRTMLLKAKNLRRKEEYKSVYINQDLTLAQQAQNRQLREELRWRRSRGEDVINRHGAIVQRVPRQNFHNRF